jgi:UDP-hydrolysing UDP-N-acetyl-D-glucosamine 2-epimerase
MIRTIAVFTGTRADYGLLRGLARAIHDDPRTELRLVVSGTHLSPRFGETVSEIRADGLPIAAEIPIWSEEDTPLAEARDTGRAVAAYATELARLEPDAVVVLGDRLEALAMALAGTVLGIPVAHVHGGELTTGAMDDALRHAITKLSYLHFVTTAEHRRRVLQLGEAPDRVFDVGAPALDAIETMDLLTRERLSERFGIRFGTPTVLLTYHPAAFERVPAAEQLAALLEATGRIDGAHLIVTGTNNDIGSDEIRAMLADWVAAHPATTDFVESFGQEGYLSTMRQVDVVAGNSSSTVLEAPLVRVPSVLVGDRQTGRPLSRGVLVPGDGVDAIEAALRQALTPAFREATAAQPSIFGEPGFAARTLEVLATHELPHPPQKLFVDTEVPE